MKTMKYLCMLLILVATSVGLASCGDDDENEKDWTTAISGDYSGKLQVVGYTNIYQGYVTLTRRSESAVAFTVDCDEINFHLTTPTILDIAPGDNSYTLTSTSKAVSGSVVNGNLNITFASGSRTYTFYGNK